MNIRTSQQRNRALTIAGAIIGGGVVIALLVVTLTFIIEVVTWMEEHWWDPSPLPIPQPTNICVVTVPLVTGICAVTSNAPQSWAVGTMPQWNVYRSTNLMDWSLYSVATMSEQGISNYVSCLIQAELEICPAPAAFIEARRVWVDGWEIVSTPWGHEIRAVTNSARVYQ